MTIRIGLTADIDSLLAIERSAPEAPHWSADQYRALFERQTSPIERCLLLSEGDKGPDGFIVAMLLNIADCPIGEIENLVVSTSARRRGLGQALGRAAISWLEQRGARQIDLEVRASSAGPIRLYEALGFVKTGLRKSYYPEPIEDAVLMQRRDPG